MSRSSMHQHEYEQIGSEESGLLRSSSRQYNDEMGAREGSNSTTRRSSTILALIGVVAVIGLLVLVFGSASAPANTTSATTTTQVELSAADDAIVPVAVESSEMVVEPADEIATDTVVTPMPAEESEMMEPESVMTLVDKEAGRKQEINNSKRKNYHKETKKQGGGKKAAAMDKLPESVCEHPDYTKVTLKTATESTMVALFTDLHGEKKFEASDVISVTQSGDYLVVFDNLFYVGKIEKSMSFHGVGNELIHSLPKREGDSGFEALVYVPEHETFYVVIESEEKAADPFHKATIDDEGITAEQAASGEVEEDEHVKEPPPEFHAMVEELDMPFLLEPSNGNNHKEHQGYTLKDRCPCEFTFSSGNKGFEGAVHVLHDDVMVLMGLCEGNFCEGGKRGRDAGNGRIVLMVKQNATDSEGCIWKTVNLLALPDTAAFVDYSAIAILPVSDHFNDAEVSSDAKDARQHRSKVGTQYHLAVTSQESSQVWIGQLRTGQASDFSDWSLTDGTVYNFPRTDSCDISYCNVEGIAFVDDNLLVAVSDKMKGGGRQHYRCLQKDQSIHTFVLP